MQSFNGTHTFEAKGQSWTMRFDFNALADFEDLRGVSAMDLLAALDGGAQPKIADLRALFWVGLKRSHPELLIEDAGDLMSEAPGALMEAIQKAMPAPQAGKAKPGKARRANP